jgi:hypothetical protein
MKLKTDPSYASLRYYYGDKTSSDTFLFKKDYKNEMLLGSIIITEDGRAYFTASGGGTPILPDSLRDDGIYPYSWMNIMEIEYCIKYQPYDFDDVWCKAHAMYSKEFWRMLLSDMRDAKIKFINNDLKKDLQWIHADQ